ncbi:MAG: hypothetical protein ACC660_04285 [Acidimicrobiales bacterium]
MPSSRDPQTSGRSAVRSIETYAHSPDAVERHSIKIHADRETVYEALWNADLDAAHVVTALMYLRSLPKRLSSGAPNLESSGPLTLQSMIGKGFGLIAEDPGHELLLGVEGRFWRLADNFTTFERSHYEAPVPAGLARAIWSFELREFDGVVELVTETRVTCGDPASRRTFLRYWRFVRPWSGLIRHVILRAIRRQAQHG